MWYKKNKINLQDISLSKPVEPKGVHDVVSTGSLEVIPMDTSNDESMVVDTTYDIVAWEVMPQDGPHSEKEPLVEELK